MPGLVVSIENESRREPSLQNALGNRLGLVAQDNHDIVERGLLQRSHDAREKRVRLPGGQESLGPPHARRLAGGEHHRGNHQTTVGGRR